MSKYLTYRQRLMLEALYKVKTPKPQIAQQLGVCLSTVYKELKRGYVELLDGDTYKYYGSYSADVSQQKHDYAQSSKGRPLKIGHDHDFAAFVERKIKREKYSPAAALASARRQGFATSISVNTLYSYIYKGYLDLDERYLLYRGKQRKRPQEDKRPHKVLAAPGIDKRPDVINSRSVLGHWEMDLICGKVSTPGALLCLTERVSRHEIIRKLPDKTTASVVAALDALERSMVNFKDVFQSITVDNGSEFRDYEGMRKSIHGGVRTEFYYCHPYCSSERGSNENANRIIRRWIPKGTVIDDFDEAYINSVEDWLNSYPRRIHGYCSASDFAALASS